MRFIAPSSWRYGDVLAAVGLESFFSSAVMVRSKISAPSAVGFSPLYLVTLITVVEVEDGVATGLTLMAKYLSSQAEALAS